MGVRCRISLSGLAVACLGLGVLQGSTSPFSATAECKEGAFQRNNSYPEFDDPSPPPSVAAALNNTNAFLHRAEFGIGHRLMKISSAYHLAKALNLTRLKLHWGDCAGVGNVFPILFGSDHIDIPGAVVVDGDAEGKYVVATNDVAGYYGGLNFKGHKVPLSQTLYKGSESPFLDKLESDQQLYRILRRNFAGKHDLAAFMDKHQFRDHFVIGLHLRLGNGESQDFIRRGRGVSNEAEFVFNITYLLRTFLEEMQANFPERFASDCVLRPAKRPLIFLATDSPKYIPIIANETSFFGVETVVLPQTRVEAGVSFYILTEGDKCVQGWKDMMNDQILLSFADVLVAPRMSTFTQSLPLALAFDRGGGISGPHFCEMSDDAESMTCLQDVRTWLFRDNATKTFSYSTGGGNEAVPNTVHNLQVHFPDVQTSDEYLKAKQFLEVPSQINGTMVRRKDAPAGSSTLRYGQRFDPNYRWKMACPGCTDFTWA